MNTTPKIQTIDSLDFTRTGEAAVRLGVTQLRVRQLIEEGKLAGERGTREWRIDTSSLEHYVASRTAA